MRKILYLLLKKRKKNEESFSLCDIFAEVFRNVSSSRSSLVHLYHRKKKSVQNVMSAMMRSLHGCRAFSTRDAHKSVRSFHPLEMKSARVPIYTSGGVTRKRAWSFDVLSKERDRKIKRRFAESPAGGTTRITQLRPN